MELNYCTRCGSPLTYRVIGDEGEQKYCSRCDTFFFDNPAVCVLTAIINEKEEILLLKQNYISEKNYTLCSGYAKKDETLEQTVAREVLEETGQHVLSCRYIRSFWYKPKGLIMAGFAAYVNESAFNHSSEVDGLMWADYGKALKLIERENNYSGELLDMCSDKLKAGE